ncbi:SapC family protein [Novosphingobium terrae]|uniref:SapC family protein n=1 Tax=Novosphingobium terrae TaxID=2726189 RepID=UPI0019800801|nr:SapC family protein [Novosphingobium terrae]
MLKQMEILNTHQHRDLHMHAALPDHPHCVQVVIGEFAHAATCCPLFFVKEPETGRFNVVALFGFTPGELLVEGAEKGQAQFLPLEMVRQGFFIDGEHMAVDLAHPRFGPGAAVPLFESSGEPTDETRLIQRSIGMLVSGKEATAAFIREMVALRLIEPVGITLSFDDGQKLTLEGLYTVSLDALQELEDGDVLRLFRNGHLAAALCIQASQRQVSVLAQRRNARL